MNNKQGIVCAGNWIVDIVHNIDFWPAKSNLVHISDETIGVGGGAANVAFDLKALGVGYPLFPVGVVGDDNHGQIILKLCSSEGLSTEYLSIIANQSTAHTHVMNVPGDSRTFFYHPGVNNCFSVQSVPINRIAEQKPRVFYLGYLNLLPQLDAINDGRTMAAELLALASRSGMMTCVDLVSSSNMHYRETVMGTLSEIDWLFLNEVEAERATGISLGHENNRESMSYAANLLIEGGVKKGCILHTPTLSLWKTPTEEIWTEVDVVPTSEIVSPVGAGDAFAAGLLHGLHEDWSAKDCIQLANKMAAECLRSATATGGIKPLSS
jgi:sugar/nucleoside kinase (ribokinase family)